MNPAFVILLFFCSGATALVYEVVWSKYLGMMLGSTVQAQTVVLAVFMGGLALGNRLFGARADRAAQPLAWYGYIEMAIGCYAFFSPNLYHLADALFIQLGRHVRDSPPMLLVVKGVLSTLFLIGPTILMGGTLPLIAAWLHRVMKDAGRGSARFYSVNSLGAVTGAWLAGFLLVEELGLVSSLQMTALFNILVGASAVGYARKIQGQSPTEENMAADAQPVSAAPAQASATSSAVRQGCMVVAITGAVSMGLEVLASRSLVLIFGASAQAFAIVLMSFILGIGLGASVMASPRWRNLSGPITTVGLLLAAACCVTVMVSGMDQWAIWYGKLQGGLARTEMGYRYHQILAALISMAVLGVPAGMLGAVLPLWMRMIGAGGGGLGEGVGRLLTWNTIGAVAGVLATGFFLMPSLGLRESFLFAAACLGTVASWIAWKQQRQKLAAAAATVTVGLMIIGSATGEQWRHTMSSGVFRMRGSDGDFESLQLRKQFVSIEFYEDAPDATVSVERALAGTNVGEIGLRINGKPDASSQADLSTQLLLAHVPMAMRPAAESVFVLGLGSGITAGALLGFPDVSITVAENARPVIRAARFFDAFNHGVVTNSRVRIRTEDARTLLKLDPAEHDVIICEPSNPWTAGIGSVFSLEFYQLAATRLKPGGVMAQWFHIYEMNDGIVQLVLRTFMQVFPHVEIWDASVGDIILLGSMQPWPSEAKVYEALRAHPLVKQDLERIGIHSGEAFWSRQLASQNTAHAVVPDGGIQSDLFPVLDYAAPRAFYLGSRSTFLNDFDERTWQSALAPRGKNKALTGLDTATLQGVFRPHNTMNIQLRSLLRARLDGRNPEPEGDIPSVFRPADWPERARPADAGDEFLKTLLKAEAIVRSPGTNDWQTAARRIGQTLQQAQSAGPKLQRAWSAGYFASVAAAAWLDHGNVEEARGALLLGLELDPEDAHCVYLAKILERMTPPRSNR